MSVTRRRGGWSCTGEQKAPARASTNRAPSERPQLSSYNRKDEIEQKPLDVSLTHPRAATNVTDAAAMQGSAAAKRDALKHRGHNGHHHTGGTFIPASVEA